MATMWRIQDFQNGGIREPIIFTVSQKNYEIEIKFGLKGDASLTSPNPSMATSQHLNCFFFDSEFFGLICL